MTCFFVEIGLTSDGLIHHEEVIVLVFQYIKLLQEQGIPSHIFDEVWEPSYFD